MACLRQWFGCENRVWNQLYDTDSRQCHVFTAPATAPATVTAKGIDYACAGYTVETWSDGAWSAAASYESCSYTYNTSAGLVRLTWRWRPVRGLRTAADYSFDDYSQAGLYWHYDGLLNQGVGKTRSTAADAKWINLGSAGSKYDLSKYRANNSSPDGQWTADGYLFRGGTRYRASGVPIGPFKSFTLQTLVDADMTNQPTGKACYIMSGIWDYFAMVLGNKNDTYNGVLYGNFQGLGTGTGNKHATVYFKNDSGHYDFATSIMDYDAKTAQVFDGVEPPTSGTGFHQFESREEGEAHLVQAPALRLRRAVGSRFAWPARVTDACAATFRDAYWPHGRHLRTPVPLPR